MILRPPKSTRTDTRVPYTTLFRSAVQPDDLRLDRRLDRGGARAAGDERHFAHIAAGGKIGEEDVFTADLLLHDHGADADQIGRASCREECVSTCRSRWSPYH